MTRILVVEDERITAEDVRNKLKGLGYTVSAVVASGEEAAEKATESDLVLMDIVLKGDIDGIRAAEYIRSQFGIPVVYLTAYADEKTLQRAKVTEPYGYILKPIEDRELHTAIEMALHKHDVEKKLKESEQWLFTTLKSIGDGVITTDTQGAITFMNPVAEVLTGWTQKEAAGCSLANIFVAHELNNSHNLVTQVVQNGTTVKVEILLKKNGTEIPIDSSTAPIKNDNGDIIGTVVAFSDITEHKRTEEQLRKSKMQLKSLLEAIKHVNSTMDINKICTHISDSLQLLIGFDRCMIFLVSDKREITLAYSSDEKGCDEELIYQCAAAGKPVLRTASTMGDSIKSHLVTPLMIGDCCVGVLYITRDGQNPYSQHDSEWLTVLSDTISSAIRNSQLHSKIKDLNQILEQKVEEKSKRTEIMLRAKQSLQKEQTWKKGLKTIVESMEQVGADRVGIYLVNPMKKTLEFHYGKGIGLPDVGASVSLTNRAYWGVKCVLEKKTVHVKDSRSENGEQLVKAHSFVWVPIVVQDEAFAALAAGNVTGEISDEDVKDLEILAGMCAAFIDRTRVLVEPVAEAYVKKASHYLDSMECYIVKEKKPEKSLQIFVELVTHGVPGFIISRVHPEKLKQKYKLVKTPMLWLSRTEAKNTINPDDLPKLAYIIEDFTKKSTESVVLLDGLEYLITQAGFNTVLHYLQNLKDTLMLNNSRLIMPLHGETRSEQEYSLLEREFTVIEPDG